MEGALAWIGGAASWGWSLVPTAIGALWSFFTKWFAYAAIWWAAKKAAKAKEQEENLDAIKRTVIAIDRVRHDREYRDKLRERDRRD